VIHTSHVPLVCLPCEPCGSAERKNEERKKGKKIRINRALRQFLSLSSSFCPIPSFFGVETRPSHCRPKRLPRTIYARTELFDIFCRPFLSRHMSIDILWMSPLPFLLSWLTTYTPNALQNLLLVRSAAIVTRLRDSTYLPSPLLPSFSQYPFRTHRGATKAKVNSDPPPTPSTPLS